MFIGPWGQFPQEAEVPRRMSNFLPRRHYYMSNSYEMMQWCILTVDMKKGKSGQKVMWQTLTSWVKGFCSQAWASRISGKISYMNIERQHSQQGKISITAPISSLKQGDSISIIGTVRNNANANCYPNSSWVVIKWTRSNEYIWETKGNTSSQLRSSERQTQIGPHVWLFTWVGTKISSFWWAV